MEHIVPPHVALLGLITDHLEKTKESKSAFGIASVGDPGFVFGLEAGREPRSRIVARVQEYIAHGITYEATKATPSSAEAVPMTQQDRGAA
jgi:hypothetical protein